MANRRHRKAHRVYVRTAVQYEGAYWDALFAGERIAGMRMAIHALRPWESGGVCLAGIGGWVVDALPDLSGDADVDWLAEMVVDLVRLRKAADYESADALRREIVLGAGAHVYIARDGIEFLDAKDWQQTM
jgi:hypothetical protein